MAEHPAITGSADPGLVEAATLAARLGVDIDRGLSATEAARRLVESGPNEIETTRPVPTWRKVLEQFQDPLIYLLLAAIAISVLAWWVEGAEGWPFDAIVIAAIVLLNAALGYAQQARAEHAVEALRRMSAGTAAVLRDAEVVRVPTRDLVPGDVLVLGEGDAVSADARLLSAAALTVSEAALTGESEPVLKDVAVLPERVALGDRVNMVFNGTAVTRGVGRALVTATGMATELGRVAGLLHATPEDPSPLQREIARVGRMLGIVVVAIAVVVIASVLVFFRVESVSDVVTALLLGVSLAVAAVPEGLPAVLSLVLALGVQRMATHQAIVKRLASVETLGSASVICSDKTGTLTQGEMTIGRVVTASGEVAVTGSGYRPEGRMEADGAVLRRDSALAAEVREVIMDGCLANDAVLREEGGDWVIEGDPTDAAFLVAEAKLGSEVRRAERFPRIGEIPFTSERKLMSTLHTDTDRAGQVGVVTKGAPDILLARCTSLQVGNGVVPLDDAWRTRILRDVERLSDAAYRTLAVAYRRLGSTRAPEPDESLEHGLVYAGMVGMLDPARPEVSAAIEEAKRAGIRVVMITGDHPRTARRIAMDLGIIDGRESALTGLELDRLDGEDFADAVRSRSVYARVTPEHKLRIVDALQADRHVVAMTGDGVNDAPALKSADIGIAMGRTGTDVTKEAAKMILADDNFATIVRAVREGRAIFQNIRKFLRYLLSSNMGEVLTVFLGVVLAGVLGLSAGREALALPLLATQILWINLLTDSAPALAMGVDPESDDVMSAPPRSPSSRVIDRPMWVGVVWVGLVMAVATLGAIDLNLPGGLVEGTHDIDTARTAGFTVLVLAQLFNALNARSETRSAFHSLFANGWLWGAILLSVLLQLLVVEVPALNRAFTTTPLTLAQWLVCTVLASSVLWFSELRKLWVRSRHEDAMW